MTPSEDGRIAAKRNWGRFGADDERGMLNLLTPEFVQAAARLVRTGKVYSLAVPLLDGPLWEGRRVPWHVTVSVDGVEPGGWGGADDILVLHTHTSTHIDSLCHIWYGSEMYNGFSAATVDSDGAQHCGVDNVRWIVGRGVLLDIAALKGVEHLDDAYAISAEELDEACARQGVEVGPGDILLVRTGWLRLFASDKQRFLASYPGLSPATAAWLAERDVVAIGADNGSVEVWPHIGDAPSLHSAMLRDSGAYFIEYLDLEELAADGVNEFLFVAAPLRLRRAIGSPLNPLAIV